MSYLLGTGDPPKKNKLSGALLDYHYSEPSDRDPALDRGKGSLSSHLDKTHGKPTKPGKPGKGSVYRGQQSAHNWALTLAGELSAMARVSPTGDELYLQGTLAWSEEGPTGQTLKDEALKTQTRVHAVSDAGQLMEIVAQADGLELMFALDLEIGIAASETVELISMITTALAGPLYDIKRKQNVPRPNRVGGVSFEPLIAVPGHASFPSGHAAAAFAVATVLGDLTKGGSADKARLLALAGRLAENRIDAGLHTEADTLAGKALGLAFGAWLLSTPLLAACPGWNNLYAEAKKDW